MNQSALSKLMRELDIGAVPHGFRSSFRDWAAECTDAPREVCELALAHVNSDRVEAAYRRSDLFDRRRVLMNDWGGIRRVTESRHDRVRAAGPRGRDAIDRAPGSASRGPGAGVG